MRALWSERPNCSHNVSQKIKRIRCFSENVNKIVTGLTWDFGGNFVYVFFSPIGNDPKRKTHKQNFGTHPVPGQPRKFVYVYVFFFPWEKGKEIQKGKGRRLTVRSWSMSKAMRSFTRSSARKSDSWHSSLACDASLSAMWSQIDTYHCKPTNLGEGPTIPLPCDTKLLLK